MEEIKLHLPCDTIDPERWRVRLPLPHPLAASAHKINSFRMPVLASSPMIRARTLAPAPTSTSASRSGSSTGHDIVLGGSSLRAGDDTRRIANEVAESAARSDTATPGQARRSVATLLKAAAAADDEELTPEQLAKLTKRVLNRASVQKCRRKQRERALKLEGERTALRRENAILKDVKRYVEACGVLSMVRNPNYRNKSTNRSRSWGSSRRA